MKLKEQDIELLRKGQPPTTTSLLQGMTVGSDLWLDFVKAHYLDFFINKGGSKVKIVVGSKGSGKTHLLKLLEAEAQHLGYQVVYLSLKNEGFKLNDLPGFYRAIMKQIDKDRLFKGLCKRVALHLGYDENQYDGSSVLFQRMIEEGLPRSVAEKEFRSAVGKAFNQADFGPSFTLFAYTIVKDRMINGSSQVSEEAWKWFCGEKVVRRDRIALGFYEQLQKSNARYWIYSLARMLRLAGIRGLVVLVDDCDVLTQIDEGGRKYKYTPNQVKDACEMIRQLIDDFELLGYCKFVFAGENSIIDDDKRGFQSYEALWMRIRSGLIPTQRFNRLSDMVNTNLLLNEIGEDYPEKIATKLIKCLSEAGYVRKYNEVIEKISDDNDLRRVIKETAQLSIKKANGVKDAGEQQEH